ncbi:hypothetical protein [Sinomicrobium soli]|uniref:hypothetical protein n=1 Tax=Sinomicrobium sp. N-1-3-6 TaxID=2219864 RepID=UPI000DCF3537|nr:hypothetical protein [Sinomicrobium sp. N-1-3-6]RAV30126.1 hypothetical protein DN748_04840 [Sinomicrobium sp. N-1-3-6]
MNKILPVVILLLNPWSGMTQRLRFSSWSNNYMQVTSYAGNTASDAYTLRFEANGSLDEPLWKISVRLKQAVTGGSHVFPEGKLSLQPSATLGQMEPGPVPSVAQIGMPVDVKLIQGQEVFLVPQSAVPLYNKPSSPNGYYDLQMRYNFVVEGGSYLGSLGNWTNFYVPLEFKAYDQYNNVIGITEHVYRIQIGELSGTPPDGQQLSLKVSPRAVNATLDLNSLSDYVNGKTSEYPNGLVLRANTGYQVTVKSLQPSLLSALGNSLPLNSTTLSLRPPDGNITVFPVHLSAVKQVIARGGTTERNFVYLDILYTTKPDDETLVKARPDSYSTTLQYEIVPL